MKLNKILIIIIVLIVVLLFAYFVFKTTKSDVNDIDICEKPIVSLVIIGENYVKIRAGIYAYGDIIQDGVIDNSDVKFMELLLNSKLTFSDSQKLLADLNHDDEVNNDDLEVLKELLKDKVELKYDIQTELLEYGVSSTDDSTNCKWQSDSTIKDITYGEYYAFVRLKNTDNVSLGYKFTYEKYEEEGE